jgi:hypothetical protein
LRDIDLPIPVIDPVIAEGERQFHEREQARRDASMRDSRSASSAGRSALLIWISFVVQ